VDQGLQTEMTLKMFSEMKVGANYRFFYKQPAVSAYITRESKDGHYVRVGLEADISCSGLDLGKT
jgi:hypothetical protein